jgi:glycosyltransferase involved in cell wall biosynthesis
VLSACAIVPALDAAGTIADVVRGLKATLAIPVVVVDDGSTDATASLAAAEGAVVIRHPANRGKGAALRTGLARAASEGWTVAVTVDADGQHPARSAAVVLAGSGDPRALVLGVRDLVSAGAPRSNRFGNAVSNFFVSLFGGRALRDTQCGLRRYPVRETLALGASASGFAYEAEVVLRALAAGLPVVETPIDAVYPPASERRTHYRRGADSARIVGTVVSTVAQLWLRRP